MSEEVLLLIATFLASAIGSPVIQAIKFIVLEVSGKPLEGKPAFYTTIATSAVLGVLAVASAGGFSPPYPVDLAGWLTLIGGVIGAIFTTATIVYKLLISPKS